VDRFPNLLSLSTCCVCLEPRPPPSTSITRLHRYDRPLRHPRAPGLSLTGVRLVILAPRLGASRVACVFLVCMLSRLPRRSDWGCSLLDSPAISVFPIRVNGSTCATTFSRIAPRSHYITACTLVKSPSVTLYTRGFSHFVTSMTTPVTSGWSCRRVGFAPTGKRRLVTAHTRCGHTELFSKAVIAQGIRRFANSCRSRNLSAYA
jgi:hypothetical protein